jgi:5-methylcytosine-specific restriction enzyme A
MNSFLITYVPDTESPERGWSLKNFQKLVQRFRAGDRVVEPWRFHNRKDVAIGDRAFLLLQGKRGPAIIGYGRVVGGMQEIDGERYFPVEFESLVDPTIDVLANKEDLLGIKEGVSVWRSRASGVRLQGSIVSALATLVVGATPRARGAESDSNPDWTRDELILALDFYLQHRPNPPGKGSVEIQALSGTLKTLGERLFPAAGRANTFRNENGVYMKLMNFRRLDPQYTGVGKKGLERGGKAEEEVWATFAQDPQHCHEVAKAIVASLQDPALSTTFEQTIDDGVQEAAEGRVLTRLHIARERNRHLIESKRRQALKIHGKLLCEVCGFDFGIFYGERGRGFIECHHTKPVATLAEGHRTHIDDLALVCANCHRMIHRCKQWLSVPELKALINHASPVEVSRN